MENLPLIWTSAKLPSVRHAVPAKDTVLSALRAVTPGGGRAELMPLGIATTVKNQINA
ncbi:hypothetical protein HQN89_14350 [Paenibacillus frigoriresistens]|nr:hypothetical protein [Paenibacillus frigoriresistens]